MKSLLLIGIVAFLSVAPSFAAEDLLEPSQNTEVRYRMFRTKNIYTFLKLETSTGRIWQVQWGDADHRFHNPLNEKVLVQEPKVGRFTLYPTSNIFTFILLDQDRGDAWQIQWGKPPERLILPIE